jgi:hypothetical protein
MQLSSHKLEEEKQNILKLFSKEYSYNSEKYFLPDIVENVYDDGFTCEGEMVAGKRTGIGI